MHKRILVTGATGFVGGHLVPALIEQGHDVVCASRDPKRAARRHPRRAWVEVDLHRPASLAPALRDVRVVYYLVHSMAEGAGYHERELRAAQDFSRAADEAGVERIIYLGGVAPAGRPSEHLESRLATGRVLRAGRVPCLELRAGMIIGVGSASWRICRDLAVRLPFMLLPAWLETRSEPIAIEDVVVALAAAATLEQDTSVVLELPGPEVLKARDILLRIARLRGTDPVTIDIPLLTPRLSSYWLKIVSGADFSIARELVEGLRSDLVARGESIWDRLPDHERVSFDEAARRALAAEGPGSLRSQLLEAVAKRVSRSAA